MAKAMLLKYLQKLRSPNRKTEWNPNSETPEPQSPHSKPWGTEGKEPTSKGSYNPQSQEMKL